MNLYPILAPIASLSCVAMFGSVFVQILDWVFNGQSFFGKPADPKERKKAIRIMRWIFIISLIIFIPSTMIVYPKSQKLKHAETLKYDRQINQSENKLRQLNQQQTKLTDNKTKQFEQLKVAVNKHQPDQITEHLAQLKILEMELPKLKTKIKQQQKDLQHLKQQRHQMINSKNLFK